MKIFLIFILLLIINESEGFKSMSRNDNDGSPNTGSMFWKAHKTMDHYWGRVRTSYRRLIMDKLTNLINEFFTELKKEGCDDSVIDKIEEKGKTLLATFSFCSQLKICEVDKDREIKLQPVEYNRKYSASFKDFTFAATNIALSGIATYASGAPTSFSMDVKGPEALSIVDCLTKIDGFLSFAKVVGCKDRPYVEALFAWGDLPSVKINEQGYDDKEDLS